MLARPLDSGPAAHGRGAGARQRIGASLDRRAGAHLAMLIGVLALIGCGSSNQDTCAKPGTYVAVAKRSASPGDCPATVPFKFEDIVVTTGDPYCGLNLGIFSGSQTDQPCPAWDGQSMLVASSTDIHGSAQVVLMGCPGAPAKCTANYDLVYSAK